MAVVTPVGYTPTSMLFATAVSTSQPWSLAVAVAPLHPASGAPSQSVCWVHLSPSADTNPYLPIAAFIAIMQ